MLFLHTSIVLLLAVGSWATQETFRMDIKERGWEFTETIELDEDTNTEVFVVPHHNEVASTVYIHDFNKNLTLRIIRETGACFLNDLTEMREKGYIGPPKELKVNLRAAQVMERNGAKDTVELVLQDWAMGREVSTEERSALSDTHKDACPERPIHWLYRMEDVASVREDPPSTHSYTDHPLAQRRRRSTNFTPSCSVGNLKYRCRKQIVNCNYVYYGIKTGSYFETCSAEAMRHSTRTRAQCHDKTMRHVVDQVVCCRECCADSSQSDEFFPYCETLNNFDCDGSGNAKKP